MNYLDTFDFVSAEGQKKKISCILIGGFAVNFYKVVRQTSDIDFLITKDDLEKILPVLKEQGYKVTNQNKAFANLKSTNQRFVDLDYLIIENDVFEKILEDGKEIEISKKRFVVPSLNHLIALKLHSIRENPKRELKDLLDIVGLIQNNRVDVRLKSFEEMCLKYGNANLLKKIRDFMTK